MFRLCWGDIDETEDSIQKLKAVSSKLDLTEKELIRKLELEREDAKKYIKAGNKTAAAKCIERSKQFRNAIDDINAKQMNMHNTCNKIERSVLDMEVRETTIEFSKELKESFVGSSIDDIHIEIKYFKDEINNANEISKMITEPIMSQSEQIKMTLDDALDLELVQMETDVLNQDFGIKRDKPSAMIVVEKPIITKSKKIKI
jgi:hypothetical protein